VCVDVTLSHKPTDDVYVLVTRDTWEGDEIILLENMSVMDPPLGATDDPNKLKFTPGNYGTPQQICLEARDDDELLWEEYEWVGEDERYRVSWLNADGTDTPEDPCDPGVLLPSGGEAEETTVDFTVQDNECGSVGYHPYDVDEDCHIGLSEAAMLYNQWLFCNYKDDRSQLGVAQFADCDAAWNLQ
jgi:hypothetical protein